MSQSSASGSWALRAHAACDWLFWVMSMNVLVYVFTLAGGIVFGAAPAAVAAADLTRRRMRGEVFPTVRTFASAWRREFWRSNAVITPVIAILAILVINATGFTEMGTLGETPGILTLIALVLTFALLAVVVPLYVHYDLPARAYVLTASRWMLRNLPHVLLLLLAAILVGIASFILPGMIPFISLGAWLTIDTILCLAFFAANERHLADADPASTQTTARVTTTVSTPTAAILSRTR